MTSPDLRAKGGTAALRLQPPPLPPGARHSRSRSPCHRSSCPRPREISDAVPEPG